MTHKEAEQRSNVAAIRYPDMYVQFKQRKAQADG